MLEFVPGSLGRFGLAHWHVEPDPPGSSAGNAGRVCHPATNPGIGVAPRKSRRAIAEPPVAKLAGPHQPNERSLTFPRAFS